MNWIWYAVCALVVWLAVVFFACCLCGINTISEGHRREDDAPAKA